MSEQRIISPNGVSIQMRPIQVKHALALWAISQKQKPGDDAGTKKIVVSRSNRYTHNPEKYVTERCNNYRRNSSVKLLDIWCRLRAYVGISGKLPGYRGQLQQITAFCECSINKLKPALKELHRMGWITLDEEANSMRITGESRVYALCELDYNRKIDRIYTKPPKINNEKTSHFWLYVAEIDDNRKRQAYMFRKKMDRTSVGKLWIRAYLTKRGYDPQTIIKDPMQLAAIMKSVYIDSFTQGIDGDIHEILCEHRPDVNRSVSGMADAWNTSPQSVSYIKRQIQRQALAVVQKIGTISSPEWCRNKFVHLAVKNGKTVAKGVLWNGNKNCTFQAICDDIVPREPFKPQFFMAIEQEGRKVA
jgi:hypothetical protein